MSINVRASRSAQSTNAESAPQEVSLENSVRERYARGAEHVEAGLCCSASSYDAALLEILPAEVIEKDYGCGNPAQYAVPGDVVVDLGSGSGKACFILSQTVGPAGRVIGLDFNDAMLNLARKHLPEVTERIGYANVEFHKARIQDMALDLDLAAQWLAEHPAATVEVIDEYNAVCDRLRSEQPLIAAESVDLVVSSCVLNLVKPEEKARLFAEMRRVLKRGGRAVISDIVCDEDPTPEMMADANLWSGCISGAFREDRFLQMFEQAGFYGIEILSCQSDPWQTINGIEFRAMTVRAFAGKEGPRLERNQAVVYQGPWKQVQDDDGQMLLRGQRMAVCDKTYQILTNPDGPYAAHVTGIEPRETIPVEQAQPLNCSRTSIRAARQTKGANYQLTELPQMNDCCEPGTDCC